MSSAPSDSWLSRNESRITRFSRLRSTDSLTLFLPITSPRRGWPRSLARARSRTFLPGALPLGESNTALKCRGVSRRFSRPKSRLTIRSGLSGGQTLAALGATTRQDGAAVLGGHAGTETMVASALEGAGLESAFHGDLPGWFIRAGKWPPFKETGDSSETSGSGQFPTSPAGKQNTDKKKNSLKRLFL